MVDKSKLSNSGKPVKKSEVKKDHPSYLEHCPDCMPLVTDFPASCLQVAIDTVKNVVTGNPVEDIQCSVHCIQTLQWWACSQWLVGHVHLKGKVFSSDDEVEEPDFDEALKELKKAQRKGADTKGLNWSLIIVALLKIIEIIKPFVDEAVKD